MPKFRFEFVNEPGFSPVTLELADVDAAKQEAQRAMGDGIIDAVREGRSAGSVETKIYDEAGFLVATVVFENNSTIQDDIDSEAADGVMRSG
jgi:hypothetical protein